MISVCIATYNGEKFIKEQLESILNQLSKGDEVVISDDGSTDRTIEIIKSFKDNRIQLLTEYSFHSPIYNFENALKHAKGDYIFLSDQDDVWLPERVENVLDVLKSGEADCVVCNRIEIDAEGETNGIPVLKGDFTQSSFLHVLWHNPFTGCCMAFNRTLLKLAIPFPPNLPMHDIWLGLLAFGKGRVAYISKPLIGYRRHDGNVTQLVSTFPISYRIKYRIQVVWMLLKRWMRK